MNDDGLRLCAIRPRSRLHPIRRRIRAARVVRPERWFRHPRRSIPSTVRPRLRPRTRRASGTRADVRNPRSTWPHPLPGSVRPPNRSGVGKSAILPPFRVGRQVRPLSRRLRQYLSWLMHTVPFRVRGAQGRCDKTSSQLLRSPTSGMPSRTDTRGSGSSVAGIALPGTSSPTPRWAAGPAAREVKAGWRANGGVGGGVGVRPEGESGRDSLEV